MAVVKNLMVRAGADFSALHKEMKRTQASLSGFKNQFTGALKIVGAALAALGAGKVVKDALQAADYQIEQEAKLAAVMRQRMGATRDAIESVKKLTSQQQALGVIGDEAQLAGAQQLSVFLKSADALKTLIPAMNDLAAQQKGAKATGQDLTDIARVLGKAMNGNVTALRRAGINFSDAEAKALKYGDEQERAATLARIVAANVGSMNKALAATPAGRMQQVRNAFGDLKENLGLAIMPLRTAFIPVLMQAINVLNALVARAQKAFTFIAQVINVAFGSKSIADGASAAQAQASAISDVAAGYGEVEKAAKKAKGAVASFDEVNTLAQNDEATGGATGVSAPEELDFTGGMTGSVFSDLGTQMEETSEKAQKMGEKIREILENIKEKVKSLTGFVIEHKEVVLASIAAITVALAGFSVVAKTAATIQSLAAAGKILADVFIFLASAGKVVIAAIGSISLPVLAVVAAIAVLAGIIIHLWRTNEQFRDSVISVWASIKSAIGSIVTSMWEIIKGVWESNSQLILTGFNSFFQTLQNIVLTMWYDVLLPVISYALDNLKVLWDTSLSSVLQLFTECIAQLAQLAVLLWINVFAPLIDKITKILVPIFRLNLKTIVDIFTMTVASIGEIIRGLITALTGVITFLTGVFTGNWRKAWEGVRQIFEGIFSTLYAAVKAPLNQIINGINYVIRALNSISIKVPDWVPGLGGKSFGINISTIPQLAKGGIVTAPTLAMIGEAGKEAVIPLENSNFLNDLSVAITNALMRAMQIMGTGAGNKVEPVLELDGYIFARAVTPYILKEKERISITNVNTTY